MASRGSDKAMLPSEGASATVQPAVQIKAGEDIDSTSEVSTPDSSEPSSPVAQRVIRPATTEQIYPPGKVKLLWAKTKVYVHPTNNKRDNIAGVLTLTKEHNTTNKEILVSWNPEFSIDAAEMEVLNLCDIRTNVEDPTVAEYRALGTNNNSGNAKAVARASKNKIKGALFIKKSTVSGMGSYAFSLRISNIYSIQSRTPNLGWWWGSIIIHSKSHFEKLPVLFFHDDESPSTLEHQSLKNKDFDPFSSNNPGGLFYGGDQFFDALKKYCVVEKSSLEHSVYLINPGSDDLRAFAPLNVKESGSADANNPVKNLLGSGENFNKMLTGAKWTILESLAKISHLAKTNVKTVIDESPAPVKKLLARPEVQRIGEDFDSAHVYLAKWALSIQEEAEKNKKKYILDDSYRHLLNSEMGIQSIDSLSPIELEKAQRRKEISKVEWDSFFDNSGRLSLTVNEVKERIFHGGLSAVVRPEAWMFLLEIYPWDSSTFERKQILKTLADDYKTYRNKWEYNEELHREDYWKDQKFRIEKDVSRNDRHVSIYKDNSNKKKKAFAQEQNSSSQAQEQETEVEEEQSDDSHTIKLVNPHLQDLREILLTYNQYNENLGYVQGMCDLLSVLYFVFQDKVISFWCFVKFMDRMERNFLKDQSGMKDQMETLNQLVSLMLPNLFLHLEKCDSINLFFFFRMLLVWFKREFMFEDIIILWEVFWTDYYTSQFHLFFALAILSKHEKIIIQHLSRFDEVLRYMNDLSLTMDKDDLLVRAELLFLRFRKMVDIIDRGVLNDKLNKIRQDILKQNAGAANKGGDNRRRQQPLLSTLPQAYEITDDLRTLLSKEIIVKKESPRDPNERSC